MVAGAGVTAGFGVGDALNVGGEGDDGGGLAGGEVEDGDGAGADVRGVGEPIVVRDGEHMGFWLAGGNGAQLGEGLRVESGEGMVELGGDVEYLARVVEDGQMRTDAVVELDGVHDLAGGEIDDLNLVPVGAGLAHAGVAVDGHEGGAAVGGGRDFVAGYALYVDGRDLLTGGRVDHAEGVVLLIGHEQEGRAVRCGSHGHADQQS